MRPDFLKTGDATTKRHNLLEYTMKLLVRSYGFKILRRCGDRVGIYTFLMKDHEGQSFYLIAKGSKLWRDIVSCQAFLPHIARTEKRPLILAWLPPDQEDILYYLFDGASIEDKKVGFNDRQGVQMINFSIKLGKRYSPFESVRSVWQEVKSVEHGQPSVFVLGVRQTVLTCSPDINSKGFRGDIERVSKQFA